MILSVFILMTSLVSATTCLPELGSATWVSEILNPAREVNDVREALSDDLVPTTPLDREHVMRVAARSLAGGLDPEVAWAIDGRWMLYRDPPHTTRLFTIDLAREVTRREVVNELERRLLTPQTTEVTPAEIVTEVSLHRSGSSSWISRRVRVNGRDHQSKAVGRLGYDDAPPEVRALLVRLGVSETIDLETARRRLRTPRFDRWPRRTRTLGRMFADVTYTELRLPSEVLPGPGDVLLDHIVDYYLHAMAGGTVPLILDRWEVDEALRHALGALLLPPKTLRWFQSAAARLNDLRARTDDEDALDLDEIRIRLMRQFAGLLDLGTLVLEGRLTSLADFATTSEFVWPALTLPAEVLPARMFEANPKVVLSLLGKHRLPGIEEPGTLDANAAQAVGQVHREMVDRRSELFKGND